jgi:hypothetical protein
MRRVLGRVRRRVIDRVVLVRRTRVVRRQLAGLRCGHGERHRSCDRLVVITIAFNNPSVVLEQGQRLQAYLLDDFDWCVLDNSTDPDARPGIVEAAARGGGSYVELTQNPHRGLGSASHGFALDVAWRAFVRGSRRRHVALLDHDVFPVRRTSLMECLGDHAFAGVLQTRGERWYAWPGLLVIGVSQFDGGRVSFMPGGGVDTGGWLPDALRGERDRRRLAMMDARDLRVRETDGRLQSDYVTVVGDWLHLINVSGWCDVPDPGDRAAAIDRLLGRTPFRSLGDP